MVWRLEKKFRFEASHLLPYHDGKCARLHGHSWVGIVVLEGLGLVELGPKQGMLMDFGDVSKALQPLLDTCLDHWHLNDTLEMESPTSERLAEWIYNQLVDSPHLLPSLQKGVRLVAVRIEETCTSAAEYRP